MSLLKRGALSFIAVVLLAAGCLSLPAYFIFENARGLVTGQVSKNAIDIAASVAAFVVKDIDRFEESPVYVYAPEANALLPEGTHDAPEDWSESTDPSGGARSASGPDGTAAGSTQASLDDAYINDVTVLLNRIETETGAASIYIEKRVDDSRKGYVFKPDLLTSQHMTSDMTVEELYVFNEGITSSSGVLNDGSRGEYLRGYAPIFSDHTGQPIGVVAVEFLLSDAVALMASVKQIIIGSFLVIFLLVIFVVYRLLTSRAKYLFTDYLTSLSNKRYFERHINEVTRRAAESGQPLSLMMIDIDYFKTINDTMGHAMGDEVLKEVLKAVSATLKRCTRRSDACCRFGGDEFTMILPRTTARQAEIIAERIRKEAAALSFEDAGRRFGVTLSIGIAEYSSGMTAQVLTELSDQTLYVSKNGGKNRTTIHGQAANTPAIPAAVPLY